MYREKDYNRNNRENTKSSGGKRSRVVQGDSVFDDPSVSRRVKPKHLGVSYLQEEEDAFHTDKPHRKKAVRSIPREERYEHRYEEPEDWAAEMFEDKPSLKERLSFPSRRGEKKHRRRRKKPLVILAVLVLLFGGFWFYTMGGLNSHPFPKDDASLGISTEGKVGIANIAFFGVDTRDDTDTGRSDAMMILTVDTIGGNMKMTSLLRDSKVPIEGHGETKLNHAYAYGGPELAVKTINQVYHTDIREFVTVNFNQLAAIVDAVGGVTLDVSEAEQATINQMLDTDIPGSPHLESSGTVVLDGNQAICYSRIRKLDSDNARTDRQQEVLNGIFASVKGMGVLQYPRFVHKFFAITDTSLGSLDILKLSPIMFRNFEIERYTIPDAQYETDLSGYKDSDGLWYWHYDLENAANRLHTIIYGE